MVAPEEKRWCIVGLGNPGPKYAQHRHNVGFQILDTLQEAFSFPPFRTVKKNEITASKLDGQTLLLLKPQQYMNLSGPPVAEVVRFYKIPLDHVVVVHDDLDLVLGKVRLKQGGGAGGHNGLKSLDSFLGKDYWRLRVGIDHPGDKDMVSPYVLSNFTNAEKDMLSPRIEKIATLFPLILEGKSELFVSKVMQA